MLSSENGLIIKELVLVPHRPISGDVVERERRIQKASLSHSVFFTTTSTYTNHTLHFGQYPSYLDDFSCPSLYQLLKDVFRLPSPL